MVIRFDDEHAKDLSRMVEFGDDLLMGQSDCLCDLEQLRELSAVARTPAASASATKCNS